MTQPIKRTQKQNRKVSRGRGPSRGRGRRTNRGNRPLRINRGPNPRNGRMVPVPSAFGALVTNDFTLIGNNTYRIKSLVPATNYSATTTVGVVPIHPLFINQRLFAVARTFTGYEVSDLSIQITPQVSTSNGTSTCLASTQYCASVSQNTANIMTTLSNMNGTVIQAFMPLTKSFDTYNKRVLPMIPFMPTDIPLTILLANSSSTIGAVCSVFLTATIKFYGCYTGDDISANLPIQIIITTAVAVGTQSNTICKPFYGFVINSTIPNVDIAEMITSPGYVAATTDYVDHLTFHNGVPLCPLTEDDDRGIMTVLALQCN